MGKIGEDHSADCAHRSRHVLNQRERDNAWVLEVNQSWVDDYEVDSAYADGWEARPESASLRPAVRERVQHVTGLAERLREDRRVRRASARY